TRTDERRPRLDRPELWDAVQRDRATGVRADLRVRDDAVRVVPGELRRQTERSHWQPHDDERRADLLRVGALGECGVEVLLLDVGGAVRLPRLVNEPRAAPPRRAEELLDPQERPERERRHDRGEAERAERAEQAELHETPSRQAVARLGDQLPDELLLVRVLVRRIRLENLLL